MRRRVPLEVLLAALGLAFLGVLAWRGGAAADSPGLAPAPRDSSIATFLLVRHAEKDTLVAGNDPPLRAEGLVRAQELVHIAGAAGVSTIYVTHWTRNRQTAGPIAAALGESLTVVDPVDETLRRLKARHFGETVLVVGHSNTVPQIVAGLTGRTLVSPVRYDGLWVITLGRDGRTTLASLRYGAPDTSPPETPRPAATPAKPPTR